MPELVKNIVKRFLRYQRAPQEMTQEFRDWSHNKDLLPRLQQQLEMIMDAYGKFHPVYDTQGIRDDGSDLIVRYQEVTLQNRDDLLSFQVKSYDDLAKPGYMQELKAQHDDTFRKVIGLQQYFLFLCTDETIHKDRLRNIAAEFRSAHQTEIIEPAFAYTFLHHPRARIDAVVKRTLQAEDVVFKKALETIDIFGPSARALAVVIAIHFALEGKDRFDQTVLLTNHTLRSVYEELRRRQEVAVEEFYKSREKRRKRRKTKAWDEEDDDDEVPIQIANFQEQLGKDLAILENLIIDVPATGETLTIRSEAVMPLTAVIVDAVVRYRYDAKSILPYMFSLTGVLD